MAVYQITRIQHRGGTSGELPDALADREIGVTTDTGEVFVGAPNLPAIQNRQSYPYQNIKILTEFDVQRGIKGDVYHSGPLVGAKCVSNGEYSSVIPLFKHGALDFAILDFSLSDAARTTKMVGTIAVCVHPGDPNQSSVTVTELCSLNWAPTPGSLNQNHFKLTNLDLTGADTGVTWLAFRNDIGPELILSISGREWSNASV